MAKNIARVHRFGDTVAVYLPEEGETVYLSVRQAIQLAGSLVRCADSIKNENFQDSSFGTVEIEAETAKV